MEYRFRTDLPIRWKDVDSFQIVNNAVYLTLIEQARFEYFAALDLLVGDNFPFVLGRTSCRYHRPGRAGMTLTIGARFTRLGGKSADMDYEVRCGDELLVSADAGLVWVDGDLATVTIPTATRECIAEFEGIPPRG